APPVPRPRRLPAAGAGHPDVPAGRHAGRRPAGVHELRRAADAVADHHQRRLNLAFAVWILNAFFSSIPVELEEASMVDGLGRVGALLRITLPLAAPGIVTA